MSRANEEVHKIIDETRRSAIDAILALGSMSGDKEYHEFAKLVCPSLTDSDISEITRHVSTNKWRYVATFHISLNRLQITDINPNL